MKKSLSCLQLIYKELPYITIKKIIHKFLEYLFYIVKTIDFSKNYQQIISLY